MGLGRVCFISELMPGMGWSGAQRAGRPPAPRSCPGSCGVCTLPVIICGAGGPTPRLTPTPLSRCSAGCGDRGDAGLGSWCWSHTGWTHGHQKQELLHHAVPVPQLFFPKLTFSPHFGAELGPKLWFPGVARDTHPPAGLPKAWLCLSSSSCPAPGRCWSHLRRTTGGWSRAWWPGLAPGGEGQPEVVFFFRSLVDLQAPALLLTAKGSVLNRD